MQNPAYVITIWEYIYFHLEKGWGTLFFSKFRKHFSGENIFINLLIKIVPLCFHILKIFWYVPHTLKFKLSGKVQKILLFGQVESWISQTIKDGHADAITMIILKNSDLDNINQTPIARLLCTQIQNLNLS